MERAKSLRESTELEEYEKLEIENNIQDDEHVLHMWQPLPELEIDEDFELIPKSIFFKLASTLLYIVAYPILFVFNKLVYQFQIEGIENMWKVEGGRITVSNHVHPMDCTMNAILNGPRKLFFPTLKSNFQIPVVKTLIRLLHAIPIPTNKQGNERFKETINELLQKGETVHFYPEAALRPYCTKLRHFKNGAFHFAVENEVPIIPIIYTYKPVTGIRKMIRRKPLIQATILEPIYPEKKSDKTQKQKVEELKQEVWNKMDETIIRKMETIG